MKTTQDVTWTAFPNFRGPIASQEASGNERPRGNVDRGLVPATAGPGGEDTTGLSSNDSDDKHSESKSTIVELVCQDHDPAPTNPRNIRQPQLVEADQGSYPPRLTTNDEVQSPEHLDNSEGVRCSGPVNTDGRMHLLNRGRTLMDVPSICPNLTEGTWKPGEYPL